MKPWNVFVSDISQLSTAPFRWALGSHLWQSHSNHGRFIAQNLDSMATHDHGELCAEHHDDKAVDDSSQKEKREVIHYYYKTRGGVDTVDQMVSNYACKQRTSSWLMVLWYNMLDPATLNADTNFTTQCPDYMGGVHAGCSSVSWIKSLHCHIPIRHIIMTTDR